MKARLVGFRGNRRDVINNYGILEVEGGNIASLIGERVSWSSEGGKLISGVILRTHGSRALLARFKKGLPGTALGNAIAIGPIPAPLKKAKKAKKPAKAVKKPAKPVKKPKKAPAKKKKPQKKTAKKAPKKKAVVKKAPTKAAKKPVKKAEKKAPKKKPATKKAPSTGKTKPTPKKTAQKSTKAKKAPKKKA